MRIAEIVNGVIVNVFEASSLEKAQFVRPESELREAKEDESREVVLSQAEQEAEAAAVKYAEDMGQARGYAKLKALTNMTPAEVQAWAAANVTTVAQARDAITTLAIAVSVLMRRMN